MNKKSTKDVAVEPAGSELLMFLSELFDTWGVSLWQHERASFQVVVELDDLVIYVSRRRYDLMVQIKICGKTIKLFFRRLSGFLWRLNFALIRYTSGKVNVGRGSGAEYLSDQMQKTIAAFSSSHQHFSIRVYGRPELTIVK